MHIVPLPVHRDLKFENIMFENKREDAQIKIIDFGLSKKFLDNRIGVMHEGVGECVGVYISLACLRNSASSKWRDLFDDVMIQELFTP